MTWFPWLFVALFLVAGLMIRAKFMACQRDVADLEEQLESMKDEKKILFDFLHDLGEAYTEDIDRTQLLNIILRCAMEVSDARGGSIYLWNPAHEQLNAAVVQGIFPPPVPVEDAVADKMATRQEYLDSFIKSEHLPAGSPALVAQVAATGQPVLVERAESDERFPRFREESLRVTSYVAVPLQYRDERLGVLALANHADGQPFSAADFDIVKSVADQASYSLNSAQIYSQLAEKKKMDHDVKLAREIQRILLPAKPPEVKGFEFFALNLAAQQVSGDYYDFIQVDSQRWGLAIADVSGKGIPASLIMAMCRTVLRSKAAGCPSAAQVLREVNRQLCPDIREDMFITMVYLVLDTATGELRIARAGHEAPLLCTNDFETVELLNPPGMALGIDSGDVFDEVVSDLVITLKPHDTIVIYTDGVNEAVGESGEEFGREHLKTAMRTVGQQGVEVLVRNIVERVQRFTHGQPQNDDITIAAIQRKAG